MPRAALVTAESLPIPAADSPLIVSALESEGFEVETPAWSNPTTVWEEFDLVIIGSAWDYHLRLEEFLAWTQKVNNATLLLNNPGFVEWNCRKTYLNQLAGSGINVIPTLKISPTSHYTLDRLLKYLDTEEVILKPVVGAGASGLVKLHEGQEEEYQAAKALGDHLAQPFIPSIVDGEISLTMIGGEFSHSVRKVPQLGEIRVQEEHGGSIVSHEATGEEQEMAGIAMWVLPSLPLYARVDMVEFKGRPALMELELIEPDLHLRYSPESAEKLAKTAKAKLEAATAPKE